MSEIVSHYFTHMGQFDTNSPLSGVFSDWHGICYILAAAKMRAQKNHKERKNRMNNQYQTILVLQLIFQIQL